jgi:hypothetical protein
VQMKLAAIIVTLSSGLAFGQACLPQAQRSIDQAIRSAGSKDWLGAQRHLEQAERECPVSAVVFSKLAETYRLLGDEKTAAEKEATARRLGAPARPLGLLSSSSVEASQSKSHIRDKWALVVGVSKFKDPGISPLNFAAKDAQDVARLLTDPQYGRFADDHFHVRLLADEQATVTNLRAAFNSLERNAGPDDLVVLFISSHGTSAADDFAAKTDGQTGYILMHDSDPNNLRGTALPMEEMKQEVVSRLRATRVVTFLDTCFSGDTVKWAAGAKRLAPVISSSIYDGFAQGTGRVLIVSSQGAEQSWEGPGNGYFTKALLDAIKQKGGAASVSQVFSYLRQQVPYLVHKERNAIQTPMMWPEGRDIDFVIGTPVN